MKLQCERPKLQTKETQSQSEEPYFVIGFASLSPSPNAGRSEKVVGDRLGTLRLLWRKVISVEGRLSLIGSEDCSPGVLEAERNYG